MTECERLLAEYAGATEKRLTELMEETKRISNGWDRLLDAMSYGLLGGGKRIRAALLLGAYKIQGRDYAEALDLAAAFEMVHAYSLIHDDLPCMDDDDTRRGKPSCHVAFGEATALLAGDALLTMAFEKVMSRKTAELFGAEKTLRAARLMAWAAGAGGMVGGQMLDLESEGKKLSPDELTIINRHKTGALIQAACVVGADLGGADNQAVESVEMFAEKLGLAFQIRDDILDVTGDGKKLGKPTGSDAKNKKNTYAALYGADKAAEMAKRITAEAIGELEGLGRGAGFLRDLAQMLATRNI